MKKILLLSLTFLTLCVGNVVSQELAVSIATVIANQKSYATGYDKEFKLGQPGSDLTWTAKNFSNNNSGWNDIRCGSKTGATVATITTDFAIGAEITLVDVALTRYKSGSSNRMSAMALLVSPNQDMSDAVTYNVDISQLPTSAGSSVTLRIPIETPAPDMYYQLRIDMPEVYSEGVFSVNSIKYYEKGLSALEGAHEITFDFTDQSLLLKTYTGESNIMPGSEYAETGSNNLNGATFSSGDVSMLIEKNDGTITPRWWEAKNISPELRLNPENTIVFRLINPGFRLREVKFIQGNAVESYFNSLDLSTVETNLGESSILNKTWSAPEEGSVDYLKFTFKDYCRCGGIRVIYFDEKVEVSGIDNVADDSDNDARRAEYFNMQGVKVNDSNLRPGLYIRRQGVLTTKVLVNCP